MAQYRYLETDAQRFSHLAKPGKDTALCKKNPFPERWWHMMVRTKPVCVACLKASGI